MTRPNGLLFLCGSLALSSALGAQVSPHVRALPKVATGAFGNFDLSLPSARNWRVQCWYSGSNLPTSYVIREIGLRQSSRMRTSGAAADLQIRLENSSETFGSLSPNPDDNLTAAAVEAFNDRLTVPSTQASSDPNQELVWIPLNSPFVFTGPHLIVDFNVLRQVGGLAIDGLVQLGTPNLFLSAGSSCGGTLSGTARSAAGLTTFTYGLSGANGSAPAGILLGLENVASGPLRYPLDLGPLLGLNGCELGLEVIASAPITTNPAGEGDVSYSLPRGTPFTLSAQCFFLTPTPSVSTTNVLNTIGGNTDLANGIAVAGAARFGPAPYNASLVLLVR
ncbi:MAG: hypothetical protein AAF628_27545 [Planctomycetota bacterium]